MYDALKAIRNWPPETAAARREKLHVHIPPEKSLKLIHGKDHHTRMDLFISNDSCAVGIHTVPAGRFADPETNAGDKCMLVLSGTMQVRVLASASEEASVSTPAWDVGEHEVFFVPEGVKHQVFNLGQKTLRYLFAIGPKL